MLRDPASGRYGYGSRELASECGAEAYALACEIERLSQRVQAWIRASNEALQPQKREQAA